MVLLSGDKYFARLKERGRKGDIGPKGVLQCGDCSIPLQEARTGSRRLGDGSHVCSDCYFKLTNKLERYPILTPRVRRA